MIKTAEYTGNNSLDKHNAIEKALVILKLFKSATQELGTIEISRLLGYHKATVSRTLLLLVKHGFLTQDPTSRKFKLGLSIMNLGMVLHRSIQSDIVRLAKPHLDTLRDQYQESVVLEVLSSKYVLTGYISEGPKQVSLTGSVGDAIPVNVTAGAKSILAFSPSKERDSLIHRQFDLLTPNTITDQIELYIEYEKIKQRGYSLDIGEHDIDINAIGAPVINNDERPIAAVVLAGMAKNIDIGNNSDMIQAVKNTASAISNQVCVSHETQFVYSN